MTETHTPDLIAEAERLLAGVPNRFQAIFWPPQNHGIARGPAQPHLSRCEPLTEADTRFLEAAPRLVRNLLAALARPVPAVGDELRDILDRHCYKTDDIVSSFRAMAARMLNLQQTCQRAGIAVGLDGNALAAPPTGGSAPAPKFVRTICRCDEDGKPAGQHSPDCPYKAALYAEAMQQLHPPKAGGPAPASGGGSEQVRRQLALIMGQNGSEPVLAVRRMMNEVITPLLLRMSTASGGERAKESSEGLYLRAIAERLLDYPTEHYKEAHGALLACADEEDQRAASGGEDWQPIRALMALWIERSHDNRRNDWATLRDCAYALEALLPAPGAAPQEDK